nr:hypothetical protein [Pandoravirus massiliensis]
MRALSFLSFFFFCSIKICGSAWAEALEGHHDHATPIVGVPPDKGHLLFVERQPSKHTFFSFFCWHYLSDVVDSHNQQQKPTTDRRRRLTTLQKSIMSTAQEDVNAQIQAQLVAATAPRPRHTWLIVAVLAVIAIVIGVIAYAVTRPRPAPQRRWVRTDGVDSECGTPCDVAAYRDVASYDECLARTSTVWQGVNFFTYNPTTRLCSLKSIPEPFRYKADAALQGATYRFPPTGS